MLAFAAVEHVVDPGLRVQLAVDDLRAGADRQPTVDPIGGHRKRAEGDQFGLQGVEAAGPVALVTGGEAEVGAQREAELEIGGGAVDEVAAEPGNEAQRIAAVAAGDGGIVALVEVADAVGRLDADQHLRLIEPGHAGGVAERRRRIVGRRRPAGRGGAEVRRRHLVEEQAAGPRRSRQSGSEQAEQRSDATFSSHMMRPHHRALGVTHDSHVVGPMAAHIVLPWAHRLFANLKRWALGVYHGLRRKHLQSYLDEFAFRFNRRRTRHAAFRSLLGIAVAVKPVTYNMLIKP